MQFCCHFRSSLSPAKICGLFNKNNSLLHAYRKVGFTIFSISVSSEEECQIVQETTSQSPQRKKKNTALSILLGENEDYDSTVFTTYVRRV